MRGRLTSALAVTAAALLTASPPARADWIDLPAEVRGQVASIVAQVGSVWPDDAQLVEFHQTVASRYKDTPPIATFRAEEQWISVLSSRSLLFPGVFSARALRSEGLKRGDIVRIQVRDSRRVDSYFQLTAVEAVLCRAGAPDYTACAERHALRWTLQSGQVLQR